MVVSVVEAALRQREDEDKQSSEDYVDEASLLETIRGLQSDLKRLHAETVALVRVKRLKHELYLTYRRG